MPKAIVKKSLKKATSVKGLSKSVSIKKAIAPKKTVVKKVETPKPMVTVRKDNLQITWSTSNNHSGLLSLSYSSVSCGVYQLSNINSLDAVSKEEIREIILETKEECSTVCAFLVMSTFSDTRVGEVLDEIAICKSGYKRNPNSGNSIQVWVI